MNKKEIYSILIIPSSEDDRLFDECDNYKDALGIATKENCGDEFKFDTQKERDAFIQGYLSGVGYLGEGVYFTKDSKTETT